MNELLETYEKYASLKQPRNTLKCTVKLAEEAGEVAEAVLAFLGNKKKQRKIAGEGQTADDRLLEELADVIIVVMNIAHSVKIDKPLLFEQAVNKMNKRMAERLAQKATNEVAENPETNLDTE